jgi:hypothetical protein
MNAFLTFKADSSADCAGLCLEYFLKARHRPAQSALESATEVKMRSFQLGLPLWSHLTATGNFSLSMMLKI